MKKNLAGLFLFSYLAFTTPVLADDQLVSTPDPYIPEPLPGPTSTLIPIPVPEPTSTPITIPIPIIIPIPTPKPEIIAIPTPKPEIIAPPPIYHSSPSAIISPGKNSPVVSISVPLSTPKLAPIPVVISPKPTLTLGVAKLKPIIPDLTPDSEDELNKKLDNLRKQNQSVIIPKPIKTSLEESKRRQNLLETSLTMLINWLKLRVFGGGWIF